MLLSITPSPPPGNPGPGIGLSLLYPHSTPRLSPLQTSWSVSAPQSLGQSMLIPVACEMGFKLEQNSTRKQYINLLAEKSSICPEINIYFYLTAATPPRTTTTRVCSWPSSPVAWLAHSFLLWLPKGPWLALCSVKVTGKDKDI